MAPVTVGETIPTGGKTKYSEKNPSQRHFFPPQISIQPAFE